jgi:hypothetical protein
MRVRRKLWKWSKSVLMASLLAPPRPTPAMSYVPIADTALADDADVIVVGEIAEVAPATGEELDATFYRVRVETVLKGQVQEGWLAVRRPGGLDPGREGALVVPGTPQLQAGERTLLFLNQRADARYEVAQLTLGAFHVRRATTGEEVLTRDLDGAEALGVAGATAKAEEPDAVRRLDRFGRWLQARSSGLDIPTDYWSNAKPEEVAAAKFALFGSQPPRWFEFDHGGSVPIHAGNRPQAGVSGGGYAEVQAAIRAWNGNAGSNVRYAYAGLTGASGGLNRMDGVNTVLFNDPNNDIAGSYSCDSGGIVAVSGWRSVGARSFNGRSFKAIVEVDTVVQNGAGCALARGGNSTGAEVMAHELGHTLGLSHPCGDVGVVGCLVGTLLDDALMRPFTHGDGRGATLSADDIAGVRYLYPNVSSPPPAPPAPPPPSGGGGSGSGSGSDANGGGGALSLHAGVLLLLGAMFSARRRALAFRRRGRRARSRACDRRPGTGTSPAPRTA